MRKKYNRFEKFKVLKHSDRINQILETGMCDPVQWMIYPSNICNLGCGFCIMRDERKNKAMLSPYVMSKIPESALEMGVKNVVFSGGGEPLAHPLTGAVLHSLKERGIRTGLLTNGQLLTEEVVTSLDNCRISVDAATRKTYEKVKGYDAFDKLAEKLKMFKDSSCELGLAFLITKDNITEMYRFCEWAEQFSPEFIHLRPAYDPENLMEYFSRHIAVKKEAIERDFPNAYVRVDKFEGHWTPKLYSKCRATPLIAVLNADARFSVCQDVFIKFGDFNRQEFREIWYSEEHMNAIKSIDISDCPRCVENGYNEIIEQCFMGDELRADIL